MLTIPPLHGQPLDGAERAATLSRVDELLQLRHRSASLGNFEDPLEEAVYIILSRQTREAAYQQAHQKLRARWRTWRSLMLAPTAEVAEVIKPAGFGPTRAAQLQGLLEEVEQACANRGLSRLTLDWLHDLPDAEVEAFLSGLPGMGPKSARCVMHYSLNREAFAVDTHVSRVLHRLGLVAQRPGKVKHSDYEAAVPPRLRQRLHVNLIHHGRSTCRTRAPRCTDCPLISFCATGRELAAPARELDPRPVAVELFAGGGGLGEGFAREGFRVAVAVEMDRAAAQTYRLNHPGTVVVEADATTITVAQLSSLDATTGNASACLAGPPCQGYSAAGRRRADDEKNGLYKAVTRLAAELKPDFVAIENVPGMRKVQGQGFVSTVLEELEGAGYNAAAHLLLASSFGAPQLRRRLIFLAQRRDLGPAPAPPLATHCSGTRCASRCGEEPGSRCGLAPAATVLDVLADLPQLTHGQEAEYLELDDGSVLLNGSTMRHSEAVIEKIRAIEPGTGPISYRRLHRDLARTVVAGHRALPVHPLLDRTISVREAARIQGFPDSHVFAGSRSQQPLQVANAVPPPLAAAVARALRLAAKARTPAVEKELPVPRQLGSRATGTPRNQLGACTAAAADEPVLTGAEVAS